MSISFTPGAANLGSVLQAISFGSSKSGYTLGIRYGSKPSKSATGDPTPLYATVRVNADVHAWEDAVQALAGLKNADGTGPLSLAWAIPAVRSESLTFKLTRQMSADRVHVLFCAYFKRPYHTDLSADTIAKHVDALFPTLSKADRAGLIPPAPEPARRSRARTDRNGTAPEPTVDGATEPTPAGAAS